MCRADSIVKKYLEVHSRPTLHWISKDTGIQTTRVFRLLNGASMRISEYEAFENSINRKTYLGLEKIINLSKSCLEKLSPDALKDLQNFMERKLYLKSLVDGNLNQHYI